MEDLLKQLSDLVTVLQAVAPEVWRITTKQVLSDIITSSLAYVLFMVVAVLVSVSSYKFLIKPVAEKDEENAYVSSGDGEWQAFGITVIGIAAILVFFVTVFGLLGFIVPRIINSDWYAIELLKGLIK